MALTQESVLSFLLERGGKVRNSELLNIFRSRINSLDPAEKQHNRELFKKLVNSVAVVRQIDEVKFVVVKKRYEDFVREGPHAEDSFSSLDTSFANTSPPRGDSARVTYSDIENNNTCYASNRNAHYYGGAKQWSVGGEDMKPLSLNPSADTSTVKVLLNITGDQTGRAGKSGAVFAVVAIRSPPRDCAPPTEDGLRSQVNQHKTPDKPMTPGAKVSASSALGVSCDFQACKKGAPMGAKQCGKITHTEGVQPPGFPQARPQNKTTRQADDAKYSESVPLEPLAHEWLVKCAAGLWGQIYALLMLDPRLAQRKDFMSGFTALHWAAKNGNGEMIHKLLDISMKRGTYININSKAHGGYTPLHIAAIHGHADVMDLLVQGYGADVNARDNDGKKPFHYLCDGTSAEIRALLGGLQQSKYREKTEDGDYRDQPKAFNTISKLFQPHIGRKQKATKFAHDW